MYLVLLILNTWLRICRLCRLIFHMRTESGAALKQCPGTLGSFSRVSSGLAGKLPLIYGSAVSAKAIESNPMYSVGSGKLQAKACGWLLAVLLCGHGFAAHALNGPVLVVTNSANPFTQYYTEILLTEGFNGFGTMDLSSVTNSTLAPYETVVLGEMSLTTQQVTTLSNWVVGGGNLIAMRPDKKLAGLLGITDLSTTQTEGYLLINTTNGPGVGLVNQTIQFHGTADRYAIGSASNLATLFTNVTVSTTNPAVVLRSVGSNGGQAAAFTFDLAKSIVYTRQGNPAWIDQDRDGIFPIRSDDLFFGGSPSTDWVNLDKVAIPQADEQQRLLANMILFMNADKKPLPRFWYFPRGVKAVVVMTGDDHAQGGTAGRFNTFAAYSPTNGSLADWELVRGSSYIYPSGFLTDSQAAAYQAAGFEIGLHADVGCTLYNSNTLNSAMVSGLANFVLNYPSVVAQTTHRMHCIAWSGWTVLPEDEARRGIRFDVNYYYYPGLWVSNRPGMFTGSGMPQPFTTTNGTVID